MFDTLSSTLTFDLAGICLVNSSSVVILLCRPLINIQSCVRGSSIQHNPILEWRQQDECRFNYWFSKTAL